MLIISLWVFLWGFFARRHESVGLSLDPSPVSRVVAGRVDTVDYNRNNARAPQKSKSLTDLNLASAHRRNAQTRVALK